MTEIFNDVVIWTVLGAIAAVAMALVQLIGIRNKNKPSMKEQLTILPSKTCREDRVFDPTPHQPSKPALEDNTSIESVRQKHSVKLIDRFANQKILRNLPNGSYGFANAFMFPITELTALEHLRAPKGQSVALEVHKAISGHIFIVGYTSKSDRARAEDPSFEYFDIQLFCDAYEEYNEILSISTTSIVEARTRSVDSVIVVDLKCGPDRGDGEANAI